MTKQYHLVGAFDRHNYGDILFPLVHTENLVANGVARDHIKYYAITAADLRDDGGYLTQSVKSLLTASVSPEDAVVLCGGDVLSADWMLMLAHLHSSVFLKMARAARRVFGITFTNDVARLMLGEINAFPYVISKSNCPAHIYFTAVGGAGFKSSTHLKRVANELGKTDGISVRDVEIQMLLADAGVNAQLIPDTALIMSDFFTRDVLKSRDWTTRLKSHGAFDFNHYYSFQGAKRLLEKHLDQLTAEIILTHKLTGLSPMFVPIGRATDHEDHVVLEALFTRVTAANVPCAYQDSQHILDIMTSLAFAKTYVGTSLHGAITTYSFGRKPTALLYNDVKKLKDFLKSWLQPTDYALHEHPNFAVRLSELLKDGFQIVGLEQLQQQKNAVRAELHRYL